VPLVHAVLNRLDAFYAIVYNVQHYHVECQTVEVGLARKKRATPRRIHTGIRLDAEIVERLSESGLGVSEEIRDRIYRTLREDALGPDLRRLLADIAWLAGEIDNQVGISSSWQALPKANDALAEAIRAWLQIIKPKSFGTIPGASDLMGPDDPPTLGRSIARLYERIKPELEKNTQQILQSKGNDDD
jgi:hypothetical protein